MPTQRHDHERLTLIYAAVLGVVAALYRLAPYYLFQLQDEWAVVWNLMPVGALSLFVGSRLRTRWAFLLPVATMFVYDLLLVVPLRNAGWSAFGWGTPLIYASFLGYVFMGRLVSSRESSPLVIGGAALLGGLQFFLLTNFLVWVSGLWSASPMYPATAPGLATCYAMALPFYKNTLIADLAFGAVIFATHAALVHAVDLRKAKEIA